MPKDLKLMKLLKNIALRFSFVRRQPTRFGSHHVSGEFNILNQKEFNTKRRKEKDNSQKMQMAGDESGKVVEQDLEYQGNR